MSAFFVFASFCAAAENVRVAHVLDGDSLRLADGRDVRLIGINAPEYGKDGKPDEPLAREARALLMHLVASRQVQLEYDQERMDHYRRTLAHARLDTDTSVEEELLRAGLAAVVAIPPNLAHLESYQHAEAEARRTGRGIWGHDYYQPRDPARLGIDDAGFRFIRGRVQRIGRGRYSIYLDLNDRFTLVIPQEHWHYFGGDPKRFVGRQVIARGWITAQENRLRLRLSHPAMLEVVD